LITQHFQVAKKTQTNQELKANLSNSWSEKTENNNSSLTNIYRLKQILKKLDPFLRIWSRETANAVISFNLTEKAF